MTMAIIKSYTDLSQSKKLAKILPLESADMCYLQENGQAKTISPSKLSEILNVSKPQVIPCWSLAALLRLLTENKICHYDDRYYCQYMSEGDEFPIYSTAEYDNPVDACVAMIEKLHELKML